MTEDEFRDIFIKLTDHALGHFPWQWQLYQRFAEGNFPQSCYIPTGLAKTSVIALWLIALAKNPKKVPRRLVYVVNRRTVVDQTTDEAKKLRDNLQQAGLWGALESLCAMRKNGEPPLALSTLRGQFADNREWSADPACPAIIAGTVDMIGSRLLFSGYGVGFKTKPLHAGFLAQDALLVHDEAHLEPAFQTLIERIQIEQQEGERVGELQWRKLKVMSLTATSRDEDGRSGKIFELTDEERCPPAEIPDPPATPLHIVWRRLMAPKRLQFHSVVDEGKDLAGAISRLALRDKFKDSMRPILVFARTVKDVDMIFSSLSKEQNVQRLTGTCRGLERNRLPDDPVFRRFLPDAEPGGCTVYLVCTSAGEVGVNISADHLICDLTTFESMAQRFGRVNRFGDRPDTEIHIVHPDTFEDGEPYQRQRKKTLALLRQLDDGDANPAALSRLDREASIGAFAPTPIVLDVTDILFDAWAFTSINRPLVRERLPGRPSVEPYLHGIPVGEWQPPETRVAWRDEVSVVQGDLLETYSPEVLLEDYPLKPHELLRDTSSRVFEQLKKLRSDREIPAWLLSDDGAVQVTTRERLIAAGKEELYHKVLLLAPEAGGLKDGYLVSDSNHADDVADQWQDELGRPRRARAWDEPIPDGMRRIRTIDTRPDSDERDDEPGEATGRRLWQWSERPARADTDGSKSAEKPVRWQTHTDDVVRHATAIAERLLQGDLARGLILAARWHDLGKRRELWQRDIGNPQPSNWLAKSGRDMKARNFTSYRHEFGSLLDVECECEFHQLSDELKDLVLHLIAAHHGRGRPHFPEDEAFDPERFGRDAQAVAIAVLRRYARLQRRYGRWGLAYLESLLRAADYAASANPSAYSEEEP